MIFPYFISVYIYILFSFLFVAFLTLVFILVISYNVVFLGIFGYLLIVVICIYIFAYSCKY